jgi:(E)-4-hydroxy-3-methylbut-2-enyl-diphosphate synthase
MNSDFSIKRRLTRVVKLGGSLEIGGTSPISVQSMCATKTQDIKATLDQIEILTRAGADVIRIAIDSKKDIEALATIRERTNACLAVDLQESYKLASLVAPYVQKIRYNPGHLHHHEKERSVLEKVRFIVDTALNYSCAVRIGVNCGSLDPSKKDDIAGRIDTALRSAREHVEYMERLKFYNYVVSIKSSDPQEVIAVNKIFASEFPEIPLHLGVTEAGLLPMGEIKTRIAFEQLLAEGIGETVRVSLTLPFSEKYKEIEIGRKIIDDVFSGRFRSVPKLKMDGVNIISCPSCSRVENEAFVKLAQEVKEATKFAATENITIAVMGCRINGPGETDEADLGLWCAPKHVNLKKGEELLGAFSYEEILPKLLQELNKLISSKKVK